MNIRLSSLVTKLTLLIHHPTNTNSHDKKPSIYETFLTGKALIHNEKAPITLHFHSNQIHQFHTL